MSYCLGVDLGTTYSAAAVSRDGHVEVCSLGVSGPTLPSVVLLRADGAVLVGEAAERRGLAEPGRVAREFKRRLGDPTPLILGGTPYGAEALTGHLLKAIVAMVAEREGEAPTKIVLTHPVNYGPYKLDMVREAARLAGIATSALILLPEPVAAAVSYASRQRVESGEIFAVYDFGGGTFDAALLRRVAQGFQVIGRPEGMERLGGIDIDAALLAFVDQQLDGALSALDDSNTDVVEGLSALREECRQAKETLSLDTDAVIRVSLPTVQRSIRITRDDLEAMIKPRVLETIESLRRTVASANISFEQVARILLVGGSSRIPLVANIVANSTGRPVSLDAHPKFAIATGAALVGGMSMQAAGTTSSQGPSTSAAAAAAAAVAVMATPVPARPPQPIQPLQQPAAAQPGAAGVAPRPPTGPPPGQGPQTPPTQPPFGAPRQPGTPSGSVPIVPAVGQPGPSQHPYNPQQPGPYPPQQGQQPPGQYPPQQGRQPQPYTPQAYGTPPPQQPWAPTTPGMGGGTPPTRPSKPSKRNLWIGLGAAGVLIAGIIIFATRGNDSNVTATTTTTAVVKTTAARRTTVAETTAAPQTTSAVTTAPATTAPVTQPATTTTTTTTTTTVAPTKAPPVVVDPAASATAIAGALMTSGDVPDATWQTGTVGADLSQQTCQRSPVLQGLVARQQETFFATASDGTTMFMSQEIDVFGSAAQAQAVVDGAAAAINSCQTFTSGDGRNLTVNFNPIPDSAGFTKVCDQSFAYQDIESNAAQSLNFDNIVVRCGNNLSWLQLQVSGIGVPENQRFSILRDTVAAATPFVQDIPRFN